MASKRVLPMFMLCDGSLGVCDCVSQRAAAWKEFRLRTQPKHGTPYTYKSCKDDGGRPCAACRKANADRIRDYRHRAKQVAGGKSNVVD